MTVNGVPRIDDLAEPTRDAVIVSPPRGKHWLDGYRRCLIATDVVVVIVVVSPARHFGSIRNHAYSWTGFGSVDYWVISTLLSAAWLSALAINGAWDRKILGAGPSEYGRIMRASLYLFGLVAIVSYLWQAEIARSYLAIALPLGLVGLIGGRWVWRQLLTEYRRAGSHLSSVLIVGGVRSALDLAGRLVSAPEVGFRVAGLCLPAGERPGPADGTRRGHWTPDRRGSGRCGRRDRPAAAPTWWRWRLRTPSAMRPFVNWPGSWRARVSRSPSRLRSRTSPDPESTFARSPACHCCMWRNRSSRVRGSLRRRHSTTSLPPCSSSCSHPSCSGWQSR